MRVRTRAGIKEVPDPTFTKPKRDVDELADRCFKHASAILGSNMEADIVKAASTLVVYADIIEKQKEENAALMAVIQSIRDKAASI